MTERKPAGMQWETWVDRQIRAAQERGEFDDLPGKGKPLPGAGRPHDEMWWVNEKLKREGVSALPPTLVLRRQAEDALAAARQATSEAEVRRILDEINDKIRAAVRLPPEGPPLNLMPYDVDGVVAEWRAAR